MSDYITKILCMHYYNWPGLIQTNQLLIATHTAAV